MACPVGDGRPVPGDASVRSFGLVDSGWAGADSAWGKRVAPRPAHERRTELEGKVAPIRPTQVPLLLLLAVALVMSAAWSTIAAAPGPLKGDAAPTTVAGDGADANDTSQTPRQRTEPGAGETRLAYRGSAHAGDENVSVSSHRAATAGRSAAGSAPDAR